MAYKGAHYQVASSIHMIEQIKDFLVTCGWTLDGPTKNLTSRQNQDDEHAHILGWFLRSTGEDGQKDLALHMLCGDGRTNRVPSSIWDYLQDAGGVDAVDTTFTLSTGKGSNFSAGDIFKIGKELVEVGNVVSDTLIDCTRGVGGTTPASHAQYDVLAKVTGSYPYIYTYAFADWSNAIAQSTSTANMGTSSSAAFGGLSSYDANIFRYGSLIEVNGGTEDGKMRWIFTDPGDGTFTYAPFLSAPGTVDANVISAGFFPQASRKQLVGSQSDYKAPVPYGLGPGDTITDMWLYGSKDGFAMVFLQGTTYYVSYWGAYTPLNSPLVVTNTAAISSGDTVITVGVGNTDIFTPEGKYRIVSQSYLDWTNNYDQSGSTYMGALGSGEWSNLDCDETAMEYIVVESVDAVAGTITVKTAVNYSYQIGALIGEDPKPVCGYIENQTEGGSLEYLLGDGLSDGAIACPFATVDKAYAFSTHPAHRRRDRCGFYGTLPTSKPWQGNGGYDSANQHESCWAFLMPYNQGMMDNEENVGNRLPLIPMSLGWYFTSDMKSSNGFNRALGVIPFIKLMFVSLGALSEDTLKVMWNGNHETFRIFYVPDNGGSWIAVGPEIA